MNAVAPLGSNEAAARLSGIEMTTKTAKIASARA
jgi:ribose/xylose/arabinose/galactoside ABC-type transport system permease subunit